MTPGQKVFLTKFYRYLTDEQLAEAMEVPIESVQRWAYRMDLHRPGDPRPPKNNKRWTRTEIELLKDWWPDHESKKVANWLGRSYQSVKVKAVRLGLKKSPLQIRKTQKRAGAMGKWMQDNFLPGDPGGRITWVD